MTWFILGWAVCWILTLLYVAHEQDRVSLAVLAALFVAPVSALFAVIIKSHSIVLWRRKE